MTDIAEPKAAPGRPPENAATPQLSSGNMEYGVAADFVLRNGGRAPARFGGVADMLRMDPPRPLP